MLTEKEEIANCWMEYYGNVFNWRDKEIEERTVKYCREVRANDSNNNSYDDLMMGDRIDIDRR